MDEEAVREYVEQAHSVIEASPQMDEANTKAAVLRDFLELLGWEIPANTQLEYSVRAFGKTYKADYALVLEGAPVAFIEAKGADTALTDGHREQLAAYMKNEDVNWGVLTNAETYEFYRRQVVDSKVNVNRLAEADLLDLPNKVTILRAFTEEAIQAGNSGAIATRIEKRSKAREWLKAEKDELATDVAALLTDEVSDAIASPAESQAKEMIDRLIRDIEAEIDSDSAVSPDEDDESPLSAAEVPADLTGEYVVKILDGDTALAAFADDNQTTVMASATNYLIENHDLMSALGGTPYVPGQKNALLNDDPVHPDGNGEMSVYRELESGYVLFTKFGKRAKKRHIERLAEKCGLTVEFGGGW